MTNKLLNNRNTPFLTWEYDKQNNWLYINWIGYITQEYLKKGSQCILEVLQKNHYSAILNDNRQLCGPWDSSNEYLEQHWIPKASEAGLQFFAHLLAPNIAGALSAQDFHRRTIGTFQMQLFGDLEKAKHWLKTMHENKIMI